MGNVERVEMALKVVRELVSTFWLERIAYLIGALAGLSLLIYAAWQAIAGEGFKLESAGLLFGSGGLFAVSGARVLYVFNRSFSLLEKVVLDTGRADDAR